MKRIKKFGVFQTAKVVSMIYFFVTAIFILPIALFMPSNPAQNMLGVPFPSGVFLFILPIIYGILTFIMTAIGCLIYNLVAGWVGGIEVEVEVDSVYDDEDILH